MPGICSHATKSPLDSFRAARSIPVFAWLDDLEDDAAGEIVGCLDCEGTVGMSVASAAVGKADGTGVIFTLSVGCRNSSSDGLVPSAPASCLSSSAEGCTDALTSRTNCSYSCASCQICHSCISSDPAIANTPAISSRMGSRRFCLTLNGTPPCYSPLL